MPHSARLTDARRLIARWRRLPRAERALVVQVAVLLETCEMVLPYVRIDWLAARRLRLYGARQLSPARIVALIDSVAGALPRTPRCLSRAVVARLALQQTGMSPTLVIGCARTAPFEAHAWLRHDIAVPTGKEEAESCREICAFDS